MSADAATAADAEDDNHDLFNALFVDTNYLQQSHAFTTTAPSALPSIPATLTVEALHLRSATTAFDLTGQLLWPATHILASFLLSSLCDPYRQCGRDSGSTVIELGAGAGVISLQLLKLNCYDRVVITDHNEVVLQLVADNVRRFHANTDADTDATIVVKQFDWSDPNVERLMDGVPPSLIVGSDVCYSEIGCQALCAAVKRLLAFAAKHRAPSQPPPVFLLGFITRWLNVDVALERELKFQQLEWCEIPLRQFMDAEQHSAEIRDNGRMLIIGENLTDRSGAR